MTAWQPGSSRRSRPVATSTPGRSGTTASVPSSGFRGSLRPSRSPPIVWERVPTSRPTMSRCGPDWGWRVARSSSSSWRNMFLGRARSIRCRRPTGQRRHIASIFHARRPACRFDTWLKPLVPRTNPSFMTSTVRSGCGGGCLEHVLRRRRLLECVLHALVRPNQPVLYAASDDDRRRSRRTRSRLRVRFLSIRPLSRTTSPVISGFITGLSLRYSHPVDFR